MMPVLERPPPLSGALRRLEADMLNEFVDGVWALEPAPASGHPAINPREDYAWTAAWEEAIGEYLPGAKLDGLEELERLYGEARRSSADALLLAEEEAALYVYFLDMDRRDLPFESEEDYEESLKEERAALLHEALFVFFKNRFAAAKYAAYSGEVRLLVEVHPEALCILHAERRAWIDVELPY